MPVTINGSGSITGLSVGGLGSGVVNQATLADGAAAGAKLGTGSVIQRVQNLTYTRNSTQSITYVATAHSVTITPILASSKILINFSGMINTNGTNWRAFIDVYRSINGGTFTGIAPQGSSGTTGASNSSGFMDEIRGDNSRLQVPFNIHYLDSPSYSVGNAIVYKLYFRTNDAANTIELGTNNQLAPVVNIATEIKG